MHTSIFSLVTTLLVLTLAGTSSAQINPKNFPFRLRAQLTQPRDPSPPIRINHLVEWDAGTRDVFVDLGAQAEGVQSYLVPNPFGGDLRLWVNGTKVEDDGIGYLFPLYDISTPNATHYQFQFSTNGVPLIAGLLAGDFLTVGRNCGGNCGGTTLDYDNGSEPGIGRWYVIRDPDAEYTSDQWKVRWIGFESREDYNNAEFPDGGVEVYLWKVSG